MSVRLESINKYFSDPDQPDKRVVAVADMSLEIAEGELVTFLGPSGCGKTTTLRIVSGFEAPNSGNVWIGGKEVSHLPPNKRDTSMVFQSYAIFPHLSVGQNIGFGPELRGMDKKKVKESVMEVMEVMNLTDLYHRRPDQLSGGQQQRVALARAVINRPKVLLFDEPLSNLDAKLREQMRLEIRRIQKTFGITSIYVTHDQSEAMTVSDRIVVMNKGQVMQVGTPFEIYSRPANYFVADFIGRVNFIPCTVVSEDAGTLQVEYQNGVGSVGSSHGLHSVGNQAYTVVRPESLRLRKSSSAGEKGLLRGVVDKQVYVGATVEYEIVVEGMDAPIHAVTFNPVEEGFIDVGESVEIDFGEKAAHLIPIE
ncbi:ABC transporter [Alkalispirochaeta sphaeroplastigenens]|uniref:ABC transporter n=1 Tax=Alkalispirochaeta sphaeroplastigenens TaxID=1187066 RepID=A0A2S4JWX3_9SPIO|nr:MULTISPECIES: ABC transporter ATP-binding protein [Alkalispirochaeta]POR04022.1 ABC transporter [Alkalispirochaeta sphaeroplastigenens]